MKRIDIGVETCRALGLDPDYVQAITINLEVGRPTTVIARLIVDAEDGGLATHLANYRLTWAPPTGPRIDDPFGFLEG